MLTYRRHLQIPQPHIIKHVTGQLQVTWPASRASYWLPARPMSNRVEVHVITRRIHGNRQLKHLLTGEASK